MNAIPRSLTAQPLDVIAAKAREGLAQVARGETDTMAGWVAFGAALNEGRALFPNDDRGFGHWLTSAKLTEVHPHDQAAAIWAAANLLILWETRKAHPSVRTVRGLHAKWKEGNRPQPKPAFEVPNADELRVVQKLRALVDHPSTDPQVRESAKRKLDTYTERFGEVKPETPKQKLTKKELSTAITKVALKKAPRNQTAFDMIEFAIRQTYGSSEGYLEQLLKDMQKY